MEPMLPPDSYHLIALSLVFYTDDYLITIKLMADLTTKLTIKAGVDGLDEIKKLSSEIEHTGIDTAKLTKESSRLAKSFDEVAKQQGLIDNFAALKKQTHSVNLELKASEQQTRAAAAAYHAAKDNVHALEQHIKKTGTASAKQKKALADAKIEVGHLAKAFGHSVKQSKQLSKAQNDLQNRLQQVRTSMAAAGVSTKNLSAQNLALKQRAMNNQKALSALNAEAHKLKELARAKITLGIDGDDKAKKQLIETHKAFELLKKSGTLTQSELAAASHRHTQKVRELENSLKHTAPSLNELSAGMGRLVSQTAGIALITKTAADFETAMAGVKKVVDGTPEQLGELSAKVKDLSVALGLSANEVASITALGGQLGVPIEQLGQFTQLAGQMAVAFGLSAEEAGNAAAKLANVFELPIEQVGELGDAINTLGNNTAAKEKEIVEAMLRIGGTAKQFGLVKEQAASLASAFISLGKPPEVAATAINALLTKLQTAKVASNDFKTALKGIGLSADEMADAIAKNPQEALTLFLNKLGQLDEQSRSIASVKLFGAEYADDINLLVGSLGTYNEALSLTADKTKMAGAMAQEFEAQMNTAAAKTNQAKAELVNLAISLGSHLLPIVGTAATAVTSLTGTIRAIADSYPTLTQFAVIVGASMVAIKAINSVLSLTSAIAQKSALDLIKGFTSAKTAIDTTSLSLTRFNATTKASATATAALTGNLTAMTGVLAHNGTQTLSLARQVTSLNGVLSLLSAWTIGSELGNWAYNSSETVRHLGDALAAIPAAIHSITTTGSLDNFNEHFKTSAESAKELANETKNAAKAADELTLAQKNTKAAADDDTEAHLALTNSIVVAKAEVVRLEQTLIDLAVAGQKNSDEYKKLQNTLTDTKERLSELNSKASEQGLGEALKSEVEKAAEAFKELNLDMDEFSTGIGSKAKTALSAFSTVAELAANDTAKLARAYGAAKTTAGDNALAQSELNTRLLAAVNGNEELAEAVKRYAKEQQNAKSSSDAQAAALKALGVEMAAVNQGMSQSASEMTAHLQTGLMAIKEQALGANELKTALTTAFHTATAAAQTVNDFKAIDTAIKAAGLSASLTAEQIKILQTGIQGGADAVKKAMAEQSHATQSAKKASDELTKASDNNTVATKDNTTATKAQAQAKAQMASATDTATTASANYNTEQTKTQALIPTIIAQMQRKIAALSQFGATQEQIIQTTQTMHNALNNMTFGTMGHFVVAINGINKGLDKQIDNFKHQSLAVDTATKALQGASVSANDLADAQNVLHSATNTSINGIIRLDQSRLDNLKAQIDGAKARMDSLAKSAKTTADSLESELARLKGDEVRAAQIENTKKLSDLEDKLADAKRRHNRTEIAELERALNLQQQINTARLQSIGDKQSDKQSNRKSTGNRRNSSGSSFNSNSGFNSNSSTSSGSSFNVKQVADAWEARIKQAEQAAVEHFATQLTSEAKRRAK